MDPTVIAAIIGGISSILGSVLVEFIKIWSANRIEKAKTQKKKKPDEGKAGSKRSPRIKRLSDIPFWPRTGVIFVSVMLIIGFLYGTEILSWNIGYSGAASCPGRLAIQTTKDVEIKVPIGSIAYFMGWGFDKKGGGYFVTFNGLYHHTHTLNNGVYCPSIPKDSELSQKTVNFLMEGCRTSQGGCSQKRICSQNILEYYFGGGKCHD